MHIVIISYNKFPNGDAGALREYSLAKLLQSLGYKVTAIGMGNDEFKEKNEYNDITYYSLRTKNKGLISKLKNYFCYSQRLKSIISHFKEEIDGYLVVDIPINALLMIKKNAKMQEKILLHDSVEWYSPEQFKLRQLAPAYILKSAYNKFLIDTNFKVIAISKYLQEHFRSRGIIVERVPIIFPMGEITFEKSVENTKLRLVYAGSPGKKDYLAVMLKGLSLLDKNEINRIELQVFGVTQDDIVGQLDYGIYSKIKDIVILNGRVTRDVVISYLKKSHFTIMLRESSLRYAKAGFPTKVVESLSAGTPVITNISSDLDEYLIDEVNSIIVSGCSPEEFMKSVSRALKMSEDRLNKMFIESYKTAKSKFDIDSYKDQIEKLMNS